MLIFISEDDLLLLRRGWLCLMASDFNIHIGTREGYGGSRTPFGLDDADAFQHVWINGQTGVGKSALLRSMFAQTVANGHGCTLIDPNGDLADEVLNYIPLSRRNDVVICDPSNSEDVLPINPFFEIPPDSRSHVANDFTEAAKHIWIDSWGERMDWILTNVVAAILDAPSSLCPTLLSISMLLTDEHYRKKIIHNIQDTQVRSFFEKEFLRYSKRDRDAFIMPIENKIGKITANPFIRNMLSPYKPAFQFKDVIRKRSILILRLPKGSLGSTPTKLLGSLSISTIINAAMLQEKLPYSERIPHYLFIDEKHNLETNALISGYSELRKYKLGIISTTQYTDQLDDDLLASMFGNVGTIIAFRSSASDADRFAKQIGEFQPEQYTQLAIGEVRVRLLRAGKIDVPFRAQTKIDLIKPFNKAQQIRTFNSERYTRPRADVEEEYRRWIRKEMIEPGTRREQRKATVERRKQHRDGKTKIHHMPIEPSTLTKRGVEARAKIRKILGSKSPESSALQKPTRRKKRRPRHTNPCHN